MRHGDDPAAAGSGVMVVLIVLIVLGIVAFGLAAPGWPPLEQLWRHR